MNTTTNQNTPEEVATFLIKKLLVKSQWISRDAVLEGLRKAGVPEDVLNRAWYKASTETDPNMEAEN